MNIKQREPSLADMAAGIGTAIFAAAMILAAVLVPLLLFMEIIENGAGSIFAGVIVFAGVLALGFHWMRRHRGRHSDLS
ncbi:MAG TPA: hypothetical protein VGM05_02070 [Planctomycetaceae bacterium]